MSCRRAASAERGSVQAMQPERVLRWLDSLDGMAYAVRLACAGQSGRRLRVALLAIILCVSPAILLLKS